MKKIKQVLIVLILSLVLVGCDEDTPVNIVPDDNVTNPPSFEQMVISFETNGGNEIDDINMKANQYIETIETPVRTGYDFIGWYLDDEFTVSFVDSIAYTSSMTLYAKWEQQFNTITFKTLDGTTLRVDTYYVGENLGDVVYPIVPEVDGYSFLQWDEPMPETMPHDDLVITAMFEEIVITHAVDGYIVTLADSTYNFKDFKEVGDSNYVHISEGGLVIKYDNELDLLWQYHLEDVYFSGKDLFVLNEGKVAYEAYNLVDSTYEDPIYYIMILNKNGTIEKQVTLQDYGYDRLFYIKEVDHGYITYLVSFDGKRSCVYFDDDLDIVWEYQIEGFGTMLFDIVSTEDQNLKFYFTHYTFVRKDQLDFSYKTLELTSSGNLVEEKEYDFDTSFYSMLDHLWDSAITEGSTITSLNLEGYTTWYFPSEGDEYVALTTILRLPDGSYNLYGKQLFENRSAGWIGVVYRTDQDFAYINHELFDKRTSVPYRAFINSQNDFVYIVNSNSSSGIFSIGTIGEFDDYIIIKDDDNFDFSSEEGPIN